MCMFYSLKKKLPQNCCSIPVRLNHWLMGGLLERYCDSLWELALLTNQGGRWRRRCPRRRSSCLHANTLEWNPTEWDLPRPLGSVTTRLGGWLGFSCARVCVRVCIMCVSSARGSPWPLPFTQPSPRGAESPLWSLVQHKPSMRVFKCFSLPNRLFSISGK